MATAPDLVTLSNGEILARGVYNAYLQLRAAGAAAGHNVYVSSGFRTRATQVKIFTDRFDQRASGSGAYNDVRWWNGDAYGYPGIDRWVRVSGLGTVAVPGTSMHEKASAVDFGGIPAKGGTAYANWMRANAPRFGFQPTGYGFGEAWHYDFVGDPWAGSGGGTPFPPEVFTGAEMYIIRAADRQPALVGPGYLRYLDGEEAANIGAITSKDTTVNTRQYDLCVSAATTGRSTYPHGGSGVLIKAPNRGWAYVAPGMFRELSEEERTNGAPIFGQAQILNDRQYDLARSMATTGQVPVAPVPPVEVDLDLDALAAKILAGLPAGSTAPTAAEIAKAVNDESAARLKE